MTRFRILTLMAVMAAAWVIAATTAGTAGAGVMLNVGVHVGDPPPPPAYVFDDEPEVILVPSTRVYYVPEQEFDLYRYGRYWYINRGGWWYRAQGYRGPFAYIDYDRVPSSVLRVPPKYHRHPLGGPPGQMKRAYQPDARREWHGPPPKHWDRH
jgi:hypothetical protein